MGLRSRPSERSHLSEFHDEESGTATRICQEYHGPFKGCRTRLLMQSAGRFSAEARHRSIRCNPNGRLLSQFGGLLAKFHAKPEVAPVTRCEFHGRAGAFALSWSWDSGFDACFQFSTRRSETLSIIAPPHSR